MTLPAHVTLVEVGPRDGLQAEPHALLHPLTITQKMTWIQMLIDAGLQTIEIGSFVSPKWVPLMVDTPQIATHFAHNPRCITLVPNVQGMEAAMAAGVKTVAIFTGASETFVQRNINCSIDESLKRFDVIMTLAKQHNIQVRGYVSCTLGCPYEGEIALFQVQRVANALYRMGCYEVSLADTIGVGTPLQASRMIESVLKDIPASALAVHFHDTYGQAIANIYACLQLGISTIDASVSGLGGCPYAKGASGNVATEDVLYLLEGLGIQTGVQLDGIVKAGRYINDLLKRTPQSKVAMTMR